MRTTAIGAALLVAIAAAVIAANFFLLNFALARNDPVGKLSPRMRMGPPPSPAPPPPPPSHGGDDRDSDD